MLGGGVAEPHVLSHVVGRQDDGAVSLTLGHGQRPVPVDAGRRSTSLGCARADRGGEQMAVVAAGDDDVTFVGDLAAGDHCLPVRVDVAAGEPDGLDVAVDGVDVIVG